MTMDSTYSEGDVLLASINTSTLGLSLEAFASGTKVHVQLADNADVATAVDIVTTTLKVCYFD